MYENFVGGLLDALVIVQYMHVLYITCGVVVYNCFTVNGVHLIAAYIRRRGAVGKCRCDDRQINH